MISQTEIRAAAMAIQAGELVAFPTETVYGLGANALNAEAVARIYQVKGRPASSPLIVHIGSLDQARDLALEWPHTAQKLAERFWPGPLTLVLAKKAVIPDAVTAGLPTVGLRMPNHDIALALIHAAEVPIAAPSANRFTELSPTRADHVRHSLGSQVEFILDDGPTPVGIESTVIALTEHSAELLRPGTITREQIEAIIGPVSTLVGEASDRHRSPGQHARHYQPNTRLVLANAAALPNWGRGVFVGRTQLSDSIPTVKMPLDPLPYATRLYDVLHDLDRQGLDWIAIEPPPANSVWDGVRDRLTRAAS